METGTFRGNTSFWAAKYFEQVYTIEISPEISRETASGPDVPPNVEFLVGNSKDLLGPLVQRLTGRSFFWLDGHWCSGAAGQEEECPLMYELDALVQANDSVIFIDDARCFLGPLPPPHNYKHWPMVDDIIVKLKGLFPSCFVTIIDDVIVCVPEDLKDTIYEYWMQTFEIRYAQPIVETKSHDGMLRTIPRKTLIKYLLGIH
ncbi:MAG: hypothetical protein JWR09_2611 [Mucilaginibacter sp.]|nr:hypothetical protein [Mucilaginibacter sp.]